MYFCEKCNYLMPDKKCEICGNKNLREVTASDFCYFVTLPADGARYFEENLKENNIPAAMLGSGISLVNRTSSQFKMYVPYGKFAAALEIYNTIFGTDYKL